MWPARESHHVVRARASLHGMSSEHDVSGCTCGCPDLTHDDRSDFSGQACLPIRYGASVCGSLHHGARAWRKHGERSARCPRARRLGRRVLHRPHRDQRGAIPRLQIVWAAASATWLQQRKHRSARGLSLAFASRKSVSRAIHASPQRRRMGVRGARKRRSPISVGLALARLLSLCLRSRWRSSGRPMPRGKLQRRSRS